MVEFFNSEECQREYEEWLKEQEVLQALSLIHIFVCFIGVFLLCGRLQDSQQTAPQLFQCCLLYTSRCV